MQQPLWLDRPPTMAGLTTSDKPMDSGQVETLKVAKQWLSGDKSDGGGNLAESAGTVHEAAILDRNTHPYVRRPGEFWRDLR